MAGWDQEVQGTSYPISTPKPSSNPLCVLPSTHGNQVTSAVTGLLEEARFPRRTAWGQHASLWG